MNDKEKTHIVAHLYGEHDEDSMPGCPRCIGATGLKELEAVELKLLISRAKDVTETAREVEEWEGTPRGARALDHLKTLLRTEAHDQS